MNFYGYKRSDGRVGIRNKVLILPASVCASDTTRIIVAQRIGTIRDADRIVVLEDGRVVGQGTHEELMRDCETYQQIALSQLSEEELA